LRKGEIQPDAADRTRPDLAGILSGIARQTGRVCPAVALLCAGDDFASGERPAYPNVERLTTDIVAPAQLLNLESPALVFPKQRSSTGVLGPIGIA
jgi:hypothetical protein